MYTIGIDIGGTTAKIGLVDQNRLVSQTVLPTGATLAYSIFLEELTGVLIDMIGDRRVLSAGISSCGMIDSCTGTIVYSNNMSWKDIPIVSDLHRNTGLSVYIANDAKCAALAEAVYGAGREYSRVCMITLGTGVGGGYVYRKKLARGDLYGDADGSMGHILLEKDGRLCTCGRHGCLEAYASASAVMASYRERTGRISSAKEIFDKAREEEAAALAVVEEFQNYLAEGLTRLVNVLRPEVIVLGGGLAQSADLYIDYVRKRVNEQSFGGSLLPVKILPARLGNGAGMIGAALLGEQELSESNIYRWESGGIRQMNRMERV